MHQPRKQTLCELTDKGVPTEASSHLSGHKNSSQDPGSRAKNESYITTPPVNAMVAAAGGDHTCPENHQPPWITVPVPDDLLDLILPALTATCRQVHARYYACTTHEEQKEKRLCTLKCCIDSMIFDVSTVFFAFLYPPHSCTPLPLRLYISWYKFLHKVLRIFNNMVEKRKKRAFY
jgi:hypothetical protein